MADQQIPGQPSGFAGVWQNAKNMAQQAGQGASDFAALVLKGHELGQQHASQQAALRAQQEQEAKQLAAQHAMQPELQRQTNTAGQPAAGAVPGGVMGVVKARNALIQQAADQSNP